jgi:hypothetical protein
MSGRHLIDFVAGAGDFAAFDETVPPPAMPGLVAGSALRWLCRLGRLRRLRTGRGTAVACRGLRLREPSRHPRPRPCRCPVGPAAD